MRILHTPGLELLLVLSLATVAPAYDAQTAPAPPGPLVVQRGEQATVTVTTDVPPPWFCVLNVKYSSGGIALQLKPNTPDGKIYEGNTHAFTWTVASDVPTGLASPSDRRGFGGYCTGKGGVTVPMNGSSQATVGIDVKP